MLSKIKIPCINDSAKTTKASLKVEIVQLEQQVLQLQKETEAYQTANSVSSQVGQHIPRFTCQSRVMSGCNALGTSEVHSAIKWHCGDCCLLLCISV